MVCQDALLFHGVSAALCNHPLLLAIAHRQVAKQEKEEAARGEVGQLWRSMLIPLGGTHMGGHGCHCTPVDLFHCLK